MRLNCWCGNGVEVTHKTSKYVLTDFELFCGPDCILGYIEHSKFTENEIQTYNPFVSRAFECWDHVTDQFYRSMFEVYCARFLGTNGIKFFYEPHTLKLGSKLYIPDFWLPEKNIYIEIKGRWNSGDRDRVRKAAELVHLIIVPAYLQNVFAKQYKTKYDVVR